MKSTIAITAAVLMASTAPYVSAQEATLQTAKPATIEDPQSPASPAQLKREHDRAIAAGDHANDPYNSASSNALNQQQLAKANSLGTGPAANPSPAAQENVPVMAAPPTEPAPGAQPVKPTGT